MPEELSRVLRDHTCIYASFDRSCDATVSRGDATAMINSEVVRYDPQAGRFGGAIVFEGATGLEAVHAGHLNIEQDEIGAGTVCNLKG